MPGPLLRRVISGGDSAQVEGFWAQGVVSLRLANKRGGVQEKNKDYRPI